MHVSYDPTAARYLLRKELEKIKPDQRRKLCDEIITGLEREEARQALLNKIAKVPDEELQAIADGLKQKDDEQ
jgi:hypothetical protein